MYRLLLSLSGTRRLGGRLNNSIILIEGTTCSILARDLCHPSLPPSNPTPSPRSPSFSVFLLRLLIFFATPQFLLKANSLVSDSLARLYGGIFQQSFFTPTGSLTQRSSTQRRIYRQSTWMLLIGVSLYPTCLCIKSSTNVILGATITVPGIMIVLTPPGNVTQCWSRQ